MPSTTSLWSREASLAKLADHSPGREPLDLVVIGGGATGLGVAVDAAARGFSVALFEAEDFAKGTSSRATKLVHGGVRYLAQGSVRLVGEALRERRLILENAPHLASPLPFALPVYGWRGRLWDAWFYRAGLGVYSLLAGQDALGPTRLMSPRALHEFAPGLERSSLAGGVSYVDGQFDDARFAVALARTAVGAGAIVLNRCRVVGLLDTAGRVAGVAIHDQESGRQHEVMARCVLNATGVWVDAVRHLDDAGATRLVSPSRGTHVVVDREFFPSDTAIIIPKTSDGRVLFAVPWMGRVILGTTDTPQDDLPLDPLPTRGDIDFILSTAGKYLAKRPGRDDIKSTWAGLRPLVTHAHNRDADTKRLSREHTILVSPRGLVTVTGGKWTTYRAMAEDVLDACFRAGLLPSRPGGVTWHLRLAGAPPPGTPSTPLSSPPGLHLYGADTPTVVALPGVDHEILPGLTEAMIRFAARYEMARSVEDVLARRSRWLFMDAKAAAGAADAVAAILKADLGESFAAAESAAAFKSLAADYLPP
jgi:glycerol-3-phosphate dehydrogenase